MSFDPKTAKPVNGFDPSTAKPFEELPPDTTEGIVTSKKEVKPPIFEPIKNPFGEITGQAKPKPGRFDNYVQEQIGEEPTTASQVDPLYNANKFFAKATEAKQKKDAIEEQQKFNAMQSLTKEMQAGNEKNVFGVPSYVSQVSARNNATLENPYSMTPGEANKYYAENINPLSQLGETASRYLYGNPLTKDIAKT